MYVCCPVHWFGFNLDAASNRKILCTLLQRKGVSCDMAEDGLQGVKMFKGANQAHDLIFMDRYMPVMVSSDSVMISFSCSLFACS